MARRRADVVLAERGFFESRERAKAAILAGEVRIAGEIVRKAGEPVPDDAEFEVADAPRYVSRGGYKLAGALDAFELDVTGRDAIDIGASTGGFTDCLLQRGASSVVALDVGYGQLAWSLRQDQRVTVVERTNIRAADPDALGAPFELIVVDVSFISLRTILPHVLALLGPEADLVALVKPQFEAGKGRVGKKGVVRDRRVHEDVVSAILDAVHGAGLSVRGLTWSPIRGPEGNIEFWLWAAREGEDIGLGATELVDAAYAALGE